MTSASEIGGGCYIHELQISNVFLREVNKFFYGRVLLLKKSVFDVGLFLWTIFSFFKNCDSSADPLFPGNYVSFG